MDSIYRIKLEDKEKYINTLSEAFIPNKGPMGPVEDVNRRLVCLKAFFNAEFDRLFNFCIYIADSPECNSILQYGEKKIMDNVGSSLFTYLKDFFFLKLKGEITFSELFKLKAFMGKYSNFIQNIKLNDIDNYYMIEHFGTKPEMQGKGIGSKILRFVLAKADKENKKCYLECEDKNLKLYEHYGFKVIAQAEMYDGVNCYALVREPSFQKIE